MALQYSGHVFVCYAGVPDVVRVDEDDGTFLVTAGACVMEHGVRRYAAQLHLLLELLEMFKEEVKLRGIPPSTVLRNACARRHEEGPVVFVYPDDVWYTRVTPEDVPGIVEQHLAPARVKL